MFSLENDKSLLENKEWNGMNGMEQIKLMISGYT